MNTTRYDANGDPMQVGEEYEHVANMVMRYVGPDLNDDAIAVMQPVKTGVTGRWRSDSWHPVPKTITLTGPDGDVGEITVEDAERVAMDWKGVDSQHGRIAAALRDALGGA